MNAATAIPAARPVVKEAARQLTEHDVASMLGLSVKTIRHWRADGKGPRWKKFGGAIKYDAAELELWIRSRPSGGGD
jgi:predicted DNA-binding transcriptional regulator AlpA